MSWASWRQSAGRTGCRSKGVLVGKQRRSGKGRVVLGGGKRVRRRVGRGVARERGRIVKMRRWSIDLAMVGSRQNSICKKSPQDAVSPWALGT